MIGPIKKLRRWLNDYDQHGRPNAAIATEIQWRLVAAILGAGVGIVAVAIAAWWAA